MSAEDLRDPFAGEGNPSYDDDGGSCDGLHDDGAPVHHLCTRCFPDLRGDLSDPDDADDRESRRDEPEEID